MIDFIEGTVESKAPGELVLSAGGVGFLLVCSNATLAEAPAKGEKWRCHTVLNVREDALAQRRRWVCFPRCRCAICPLQS